MTMENVRCYLDDDFQLAFENSHVQHTFGIDYLGFDQVFFEKKKDINSLLKYLNKKVAKSESFFLKFVSLDGSWDKRLFKGTLASVGSIRKKKNLYLLTSLVFEITCTSLDFKYPHECALCHSTILFSQIMERDLNHDHLYEIKDGKYHFTPRGYLLFHERWKELKRIWVTTIVSTLSNRETIEMKQEFLCNECHSKNISIGTRVIHDKHEKKPRRRMRISHEEENGINSNIVEILRDPSFFQFGQRRETCSCNGVDIFLGAIVTNLDERHMDIDLCARGERPLGIVIGQAFPHTISFEHSHQNPFPDNEYVFVEELIPLHFGLAYIKHENSTFPLTPNDLLCCEAGFLVKTEDPSEAIARFVGYHQGMNLAFIKVGEVRWL